MPSEAVEVYRSARRADCEERAFVLLAVGVPSETAHLEADQLQPEGLGGGFRHPVERAPWPDARRDAPDDRDRRSEYYVLLVAPHQFAEARTHLLRYEEERRRPEPPQLPEPHLYAHAWLGCLFYAAVLLWVAYAVGAGRWRLDAFDIGDLYAAAVQHGQYWRAWTALTLHLGPDHLAANLGAGIWFGWLAGRLLGPGTAWALIVNGAAAANLIEGLLAAPDERSAGASTAVFTALGLLSAYSWRERRLLPQRRALTSSPLVAGIVLLGWFGTSGEHTDIFAHLAGFTVGVLLGAAAAIPFVRRLLERIPQWLGGAVALGAVIAAWAWGLRS